mgnify:CR=1 FL=1
MDDAEYIYKQDVKEKAITARSSHKYGSSRRRRCGLSSDNLTRKEWERMNGPVHTLKPDEALSWDRFRALPKSLQQDYIKHILSKFKVGPAALGRMFGVSEAYCGDYLKKQLGITFQGRTTRQETLRFLNAYLPEHGPVCADKKNTELTRVSLAASRPRLSPQGCKVFSPRALRSRLRSIFLLLRLE